MTLSTAMRTPATTTNRNGDRSTNVKVVVRVRPENTAEHNAASRIVVRAMNEHVLVFDPKDEQVHTPGVQRKVKRDITKRARKDLKFAFDFVFGPHSTNQSVYEQTTKTILDGFINGYNCSVFAYGATGAGKTHTMLGNEKKPGVMFLTMVDLYERIAAIREEKSCEVAVSYLEVYNEQIRDLLLPQGQLPIREDSMNGVVIQGLSLHKPNSAEELLYMLQYGNKNRSQHPTDANAESSRSHAVFQVFMKQKDRTANISAEVKVAKMCLVDLAGSERATVTTNRGARLREGANINKSLLALGNVINALADNKSKGHVPYRDSKLTRILKDSLGGNCRTVMIAAVSPSSMSFDDTYNTLKYADRAKNISATLKKNILNVDFHVVRYGQIVEDLRKEIVELKSKLGQYEEGKVVAGCLSVKNSFNEEVVRLQDVLHKVFASRISVRKELLENEITKRDVLWKIHKKEKVRNRLNILVGESQVCDNIQKTVKKSRSRLDQVDKQMVIAGGKYEENCAWLNRVTDEMKMAGGDSKVIPEMLEVSLRMHQLEVELGDSRFYLKHLKKLVKNQEKSSEASDRLITTLLQLVKKQHFTLKGHDLLTSELEADYENVEQVINSPQVSWADETNMAETEEEKFHISDIINLPVISLLSLKGPTPSRVRNNRRSASLGNSTPKLPKDNYNQTDKSKTVIKESMEPRRVLADNINTLEPKRHNIANPARLASGPPGIMEPQRVLADNVNTLDPKRQNVAIPARTASSESSETNTGDLNGTFTLEEPKPASHSQPGSAMKSSNKDNLRRAVLSANTFNQKSGEVSDSTKNSLNTNKAYAQSLTQKSSDINNSTKNSLNSNKADGRSVTQSEKENLQTLSVECPHTPNTDSNIVNSYKARDDRPITPKRSYDIPNTTSVKKVDSSVSKLINSTKLNSGEDFLTPKKPKKLLNSLENESPVTPQLPDSIVKSYAARDERPITPKASYDFSSGINCYQAREERPITPKASYDPKGFNIQEESAQNIVKNLDATFVKTVDDKHLNTTYVKSVLTGNSDQTIIVTSPKVLRENVNVCNVNSSTVTKVNSATVTKSAPCKNDAPSQDQEVRKPVARSIKFESTPPSGNGMSYADAVKTPSPVRTPLLQISNNTGTNDNRLNITPLQSKLNLDAYTPNLRLSNKCKENLKKLRQKMEKSMSTSKQIGRHQPNYMSLTKSAKSRNRLNFKDGSDDNMAPRRVPISSKTSSSNLPKRNPWMARSKSATSLPRSGWQF